MASINVTGVTREVNRCPLLDPIWVQGWTLGLHVLLRSVPVDAHFPGDASNRQPPALRLLHSLPSCRLKWSGFPTRRGNGSADYGCAAFFDHVVRIGDVGPGVEFRQDHLPAPAQTVEAAVLGRPV